MFDLILEHGLVVDGTGQAPYPADVAVTSGRIAAIGDLSAAEARERVDVAGQAVAPGFIDIHTHSDLPLLINPRAESKIRQGVTTEVIGNCGFSPAPLTESGREDVRQLNSFIAKGAGELSWDWTTVRDFLTRLEAQGTAVNVAPLVGHVTLRIDAMSFERRPPTAEEMACMKALLRQAMDEGMFGMSSGLVYPPSCYADTEELVELSKVVAEYGGLYFSHIRGEGATLLRAVAEAVEIGERAKVGVEMAHHKASGRAYWGRIYEAIELSQRAWERGTDITFDVYPYTAGSAPLTQIIPEWAHAGGPAALVKRISESPTREDIAAEIARENRPWDQTFVSWVPSERNKPIEGKSIAVIAEMRHIAPIEALFAVLVEEDAKASMVHFAMSEDDVRYVVSHPRGMIGSDGSSLAPYGPLAEGTPHPRNYGTFPRVLQVYVREQGAIRLEEAVRKMTSASARKLGLKSKGLVRPGLDADLVVFDPGKVSEQGTYSAPHQYAKGISHVLVDGKFVIRSGEHTGALAGKVLRRG